MTMSTNAKFFIFLLITLIIASGILFIPFFAEQELGGTAVLTFVSTATLLGAVWYFLTSLKSFKPALKIAYYFLTIGIAVYSFILVQFFLTLFIELDVALRNALFLVPYALSSFFIYIGMSKFARLLEVKTIWASFSIVFGIGIIAAIIMILVPPPAVLIEAGIDELTLDIITGTLAWSTVLGMSAGMAALRIHKAISLTYSKAIIWVMLAQFMLAFSAIHELIVKIYFSSSTYVASDFSAWPFILTGILFLRAGFAFREARISALNLPDNTSYVDIVAATATLVSKPAAIAHELEELQSIAVRTNATHVVSQEDKLTLKQLYLYLEEYLVTKEPLARFSRDTLRDNLPKDFASSLGRQVNSDFFHSQ